MIMIILHQNLGSEFRVQTDYYCDMTTSIVVCVSVRLVTSVDPKASDGAKSLCH